MNGLFFNGKIEDNYWGHIFAEVYKDRVYAPYLEGKENLTIVDVGANVGIVSHYFSQFAKKVYSVEPSTEHMECLKEMIRYNKLGDKVIPIQTAVYSKDGELDFFRNQNRTMYSLHMAVADKSLGSEKVRAITLGTLFKEQKIGEVDFLKLDVEGSEYEILGSDTFDEPSKKIKRMLIEYHTWSGVNPHLIIEALRERGFTTSIVPNDASLIFATK